MVLLHSPQLAEADPTWHALVRFDSEMRPLVSLEVGPVRERPRTVGAAEHLGVMIVRLEMPGEILLRGALFRTEGATVLFNGRVISTVVVLEKRNTFKSSSFGDNVI